MLGVRFLSLIALVATLLVARIALSTDVPCSDRAEVPGGQGSQGDDDGGADDAGRDLALPPGTTLTAVLFPTLRLIIDLERSPTTSAFAVPIFRPPISALA